MSFKVLRTRLLVLFAISVVLALGLPWWCGVSFSLSVFVALTLAFWVMGHMLLLAVKEPNTGRWRWPRYSGSAWAMFIAHFGMGVCVIGLVLNTAYAKSLNASVHMGGKVALAHYQFQLASVTPVQGPNYTGQQAQVIVTHEGKQVAVLYPQQRYFPVAEVEVAKTAIDAKVFRDLYVALGDKTGPHAYGMRIYFKPFVRWIWIGGLLMALGGICAVFDRRYRKKSREVQHEK